MDLVRDLRHHLGMFIAPSPVGYNQVVAYLLGFNRGTNHLAGFQEHVERQLATGPTSLHWSGLIADSAQGDSDEVLIEALLDLLDSFRATLTQADW